jgi:hypothetical protein
MAKALSTGFQRIVHRARPVPVGSRLRVTRYRHVIAAQVQGVSATPVMRRGLCWAVLRYRSRFSACFGRGSVEAWIIDTAAAVVGVSKTVGWRWFREAGGVMPPQWCEPAGRPARLSLADREGIACRRVAGEGVRAIAGAIGRSPSTIGRELTGGTCRPKTGYRATVAQALADKRARRPKTALLRRDTR